VVEKDEVFAEWVAGEGAGNAVLVEHEAGWRVECKG